MSDLAALEIIASINKLASEVNNMNQSKGLSWVGPIIGVITGFSINLLYTSFSKNQQTKRYRKCIDNEVKRMRVHSIEKLNLILLALDNLLLDSDDFPTEVPMVFPSICYEKFYHEIVDTLDEKENKNLCNSYGYLADAESKVIYLEELAKKGELDNIYNVLEVILTSYCGVCYSVDVYLGADDTNKFKGVEVLKQLGIKSTYIDMLIKNSPAN